MENQIIITKERLKMAYKDADEQQKGGNYGRSF